MYLHFAHLVGLLKNESLLLVDFHEWITYDEPFPVKIGINDYQTSQTNSPVQCCV